MTVPAIESMIEQSAIVPVVGQPDLHDFERRKMKQVDTVWLVRSDAVGARPAQRR